MPARTLPYTVTSNALTRISNHPDFLDCLTTGRIRTHLPPRSLVRDNKLNRMLWRTGNSTIARPTLAFMTRRHTLGFRTAFKIRLLPRSSLRSRSRKRSVILLRSQSRRLQLPPPLRSRGWHERSSRSWRFVQAGIGEPCFCEQPRENDKWVYLYSIYPKDNNATANIQRLLSPVFSFSLFIYQHVDLSTGRRDDELS